MLALVAWFVDNCLFSFSPCRILSLHQRGEKHVNLLTSAVGEYLLYIVFRMAQSEPSSGVKGKAIHNKNLTN